MALFWKLMDCFGVGSLLVLNLMPFLNQVLPLYAGPCLSSCSAVQDASFYREKRPTPPWKALEHSRTVSLNAWKHVAKQQEKRGSVSLPW